MEISKVIAIIVGVVSVSLFILALTRCKHKAFYHDTLLLWPLGIYVWGDALILAPFWLTMSITFWWLPLVFIIRFWLLFLGVRGAYEVIYWLHHQFNPQNYRPPLFRSVSWLKNNDVAILYQLLNMCQVVVALALLVFSFNLERLG